MSTLMERGLNMILRQLPEVAGGIIIYRRDTSNVRIEATFGKSEFTVETTDGVLIEQSDRDFIFAASALVLNGTLATPERGDRIETGDGTVYEVLPMDGRQCYRSFGSDSSGSNMMFRVFSKKVP